MGTVPGTQWTLDTQELLVTRQLRITATRESRRRPSEAFLQPTPSRLRTSHRCDPPGRAGGYPTSNTYSARPSARGADPARGTGRSTGPQGPRLLQGVGWESGITPTSNSSTAAGAFLGSPCESGEGRRVPGGWRRPRAEGGPRVAGRGGGARRPRLLRSAAGRWARARRAGVRPGRAPPPELGRAIPMMPSHRARLPERGRRLPPPPVGPGRGRLGGRPAPRAPPSRAPRRAGAGAGDEGRRRAAGGGEARPGHPSPPPGPEGRGAPGPRRPLPRDARRGGRAGRRGGGGGGGGPGRPARRGGRVGGCRPRRRRAPGQGRRADGRRSPGRAGSRPRRQPRPRVCARRPRRARSSKAAGLAPRPGPGPGPGGAQVRPGAAASGPPAPPSPREGGAALPGVASGRVPERRPSPRAHGPQKHSLGGSDLRGGRGPSLREVLALTWPRTGPWQDQHWGRGPPGRDSLCSGLNGQDKVSSEGLALPPAPRAQAVAPQLCLGDTLLRYCQESPSGRPGPGFEPTPTSGWPDRAVLLPSSPGPGCFPHVPRPYPLSLGETPTQEVRTGAELIFGEERNGRGGILCREAGC